MNLMQLICEYVQAHPGCTSTDICNAYPHYGKNTITSGVSKLKHKNRLRGIERDGRVCLYSTRETPVETDYNQEPNCTEPNDLDTRRVLDTLEPLERFIKIMQRQGLNDQTFVWMSATTDKPVVELIGGDVFMKLGALLEDLRN